MTTYRKKPVTVEAVQWTGESTCAEVFAFLGMEHPDDELDHSVIRIPTLEGTMTARQGDWIIRGVKGEYYPCKPDIFAETYEPAEPAPPAELTEARCWSCDHLATSHQGDGCHHPITCALVSVETADFDALCSCAVSAESAATPEQDGEQPTTTPNA